MAATLARWQSTIVDQFGNIMPGAQVTVRSEAAGAPLAALFTDRAGTVALGNPFTVGVDAFAAFHVTGGAYRITATLGAVSQDYRYVAIGRASESDQVLFGVPYLFDTSVADADPGSGKLRLNNATYGSVTTIFLDILTAITATDISAYIATWDDSGSAADRGVIIIQSLDGTNFWMGTITGTNVVGTNYRKVAVTFLASSGAFTAGEAIGVVVIRRGVDGTVSGPGVSVNGDIAVWNGTGGTALSDSGKTINNVGAGKQSIWVPASAMTLRGAAAASAVLITNQLVNTIIAFDPTTFEDAFFSIKMPKSWDVGTITFRAVWSHAATVTNFGVTWQLTGVPLSDGDLLTTVITDSCVQVDTGGTTDTIYISPESPTLTMATPARAAEDYVVFRAARLATDGADTMTIDARLHGVMLFYTTNANTDA